jgi:S-methylmethionine-dependent homocysteine/selenocysteine methylase/SAM-dependent methyltransferase
MTGAAVPRTESKSAPYRRVLDKLDAGSCVILDGATGTELPHLSDAEHALDERRWGARALVEESDAILDLHRRYVGAGCDVISTNTWALPSALLDDAVPVWSASEPVHWMDLARRGLRLARQAVADGGRSDDCAVAFSINGDVDSDQGESTIRLLARLFADEAPDLILLETLTLVRPSLFATVQRLLDTGLPVWMSFRRCRHGLCSVYGEHWGGPEGDTFGRAAARLEEMGIGALMINCIPPDHVDGMVPYLRDFTDLPLGVYPNLGYYTDDGWRFGPGVGSSEYAAMALRWRAEGAQIIGGCCGVGADHVAAARNLLEQTEPSTHRSVATASARILDGPRPPAPAWTDRRRRTVYPLEFPDLVADLGVTLPPVGSLMAWRYLYDHAIGSHQRCLDIGSGTGVLGIQLALNGASHVRAIDVDERAVRNTAANAHRNGVADRMTAARIDIYPWVPEERYEVIVACVEQTPVDPEQQHVGGRRAVDYWGRAPMDHLLNKLTYALAPEGVAYVTQLSLLSQQRTAELLSTAGLEVQVVDYEIFPFPPELDDHREQIARVEELSDAHHLRIGEHDLVVAYLLEIRAAADPEGVRAAR